MNEKRTGIVLILSCITDVILLLCYHTEIIQQSGGQDVIKKYGKDGYAVIWYPIDDFGVPTVCILVFF